MGYPVQIGNTLLPLRFNLILSNDHITGATGKTPTVTIDKNDGLGFVSPIGAVSELGNGIYQVAANASDASIIGPISLHATASGCDPSDETFLVVAYSPSLIPYGLTPSSSTISVESMITSVLKRINVLQAGETISAEDLADGFQRFGDFIDGLANERLMMYQMVRSTWTLNATKGVPGNPYTVGPSGDVNIARPIWIDHVNYNDTSQTPTLERPLSLITSDAYAAIPLKTLTSPLPGMVYYEPSFPTGSLYIWMVPTSSTLQGVIYAPTAVVRYGSPSDLIALPPGYNRFLRDNLALEFWPEWRENVPVDPTLVQSAMESKKQIKTANLRQLDLSIDPALLIRRGVRYSIYSDTSF